MSQTIRQMIINDEDVKGLFVTLNDMSLRVKETSDTLVAAEFEAAGIPGQLKEAEQKIGDVEREVMFEVLNDTGENGKPKYTNENQRKAAQSVILSKSEDYVAAKNDLLKLKQHKAEVENHIARTRNHMLFTENLFKATIAASGLVAGLCYESTTYGKLEQIERLKGILKEI